MQEIYVENIREILRNKKGLEKKLKVNISNKGKNIFIEGEPEHEFIALQLLKAVNLGFSVDTSLRLTEEGVILQTLNIKDITKSKNLERIRARIIGSNGKTLKTLFNLTNCSISLHYNKIGIIGDSEEIEDAIQALKSIVYGSKQGKVYGRLERRRKEKRTQLKNLGLNIEGNSIEE